MKKILTVTVVLFTFIATVALIGCTSNKPSTQNPPQQSNNTKNTNNINNTNNTNNIGKTAGKTFTLDELKKYTGANGTPAYVAVNGTVYDVTNVRRWKNGTHFEHFAGTDLSNVIGRSPHGKGVLREVPVVGTLK